MLSGPGPSQAVFVFCSFFCFVTEEKAEILHSFTSEPASGTGHNWWLTLSPGSKKAWPRHVTGTTNHLRIILICLKGIDTVVFLLFLFCFFGRPKSKQKFWHPSQRISWEKIICQPCCVCPFPYEYVCPVAPNHWPLWARILLVTFKIGTQLLSGALSNFLMTDLLWSPAAFMVGQFSEEKNLNSTFKWQLHCAIYTIDLSSVHSRCPPELVCLIFLFSCLSFMFWMLLISAKRLWNFKKKNKKTHLTPIFQNLDSLQTTSPLETVGKILQRGRSSCWTVYAANCTKKWHWGTQQCTLPLCVPQPHPTETETTAGLDGSGHLAQYQIRGVSPNAVDLRVFLAFGTVQTEETKIFFWVLRVLS